MQKKNYDFVLEKGDLAKKKYEHAKFYHNCFVIFLKELGNDKARQWRLASTANPHIYFILNL